MEDVARNEIEAVVVLVVERRHGKVAVVGVEQTGSLDRNDPVLQCVVQGFEENTQVRREEHVDEDVVVDQVDELDKVRQNEQATGEHKRSATVICSLGSHIDRITKYPENNLLIFRVEVDLVKRNSNGVGFLPNYVLCLDNCYVDIVSTCI